MPCSRIYTSLAVLLAVLLSSVCEGTDERGVNAQNGFSSARYDSVVVPMKNTPMHLVVARKALPVPACILKRDLSLQSHFMMLHLCWSEQRFNEQKWEKERKRQERREDSTIPLKQAIWPMMAIWQSGAPRGNCTAASEAATV
ncbi:MAG: hypothetical protein WAN92_05025 [Herbaspirillum sp.]